MRTVFSPDAHASLLHLLARSDYVARYIAFCDRYPQRRDIDAPSLDLTRTLAIFRNNGVTCRLDRKFKVFIFDTEEIGGWQWHGSLVVKRHDALDTMMEGHGEATGDAVGSSLGDIASEIMRMQGTYEREWRRLARPDFDGTMAQMERMVPDLVQLFRSMKDIIRQNWPVAAHPPLHVK